MSTVKEVFDHYEAKVTFPITPDKIKAAGYDVGAFLESMIRDVSNAEDSHKPEVQDFLRKIHLLEIEAKKT